MVGDSLNGERTLELLHCPPHEGTGREEAADVRKQDFIRRASTLRPHVLTCHIDVHVHLTAFNIVLLLSWQTRICEL